MQIARRVSQIVFLILYFALFLLAAYPLQKTVPVQFFLRLDPLLGITASIAARVFVLSIPAIILIFLSIVFGRFFCGWICPVGTTIDGSDNILQNKNKKTYKSVKNLKFVILLAVLFAAVFSIQLNGFLDPIPLFTRTVVTALYPLFVFLFEGFLNILMSIGFLEEPIFKVHDSLRGIILPIAKVSFLSSVALLFIFTGILFLGKINKRFWCRNICPLGALLALASKRRWYRRHVSDTCTECGLCAKVCRMGAIPENFKATDHVECISCMDCEKVCPVNAIHFGFQRKMPAPTKVDLTRRHFISAGAAGLLSMGVLNLGRLAPKEKGVLVRPPGALEEGPFLDRCVRCGECVRVCSTSGAGLQLSNLENGWSGIWTPVLKPYLGYCEYNCNMCGEVCPTGAIQPLPLEERQEMKMGTAHFDKTRCIPWYYGENCMVCEEHCPIPDKAIHFREIKTVTIDGREAVVSLPYVKEEVCIGCGICVNRCPVEGERGIFLTNADEYRWS